MDERVSREIEHAKFLIEHGAGKIWNWEGVAGKKRWKRRSEMLVSSISPNSEILEIGCGTAYFTEELQKTGANITATDISSDLLDIARRKVGAKNVTFLRDDAHRMQFPSGHFDSVVGSSILHHLDIDLALKEIFRVLRNGGAIAFTEPSMMNPQVALQKNIPWLKKKLGDSPDETAFFRWSLKNKLSKLGFHNISIIPFDFLHPKLPGSIIRSVDPLCRVLEKIPFLKELSGSLFITARK